MTQFYNPFQNLELRVPNEFYDDMVRYTQTRSEAGERISVEESPVPRYVDMWVLGACLGAKYDQRREVPRSGSRRFITGEIFAGDQATVDLLELIAVGVTGDPEIVARPKEEMDLLNDLAAGGLPLLIEMLRDGQAKPLHNVSRRLFEEISASAEPAQGT